MNRFKHYCSADPGQGGAPLVDLPHGEAPSTSPTSVDAEEPRTDNRPPLNRVRARSRVRGGPHAPSREERPAMSRPHSARRRARSSRRLPLRTALTVLLLVPGVSLIGVTAVGALQPLRQINQARDIQKLSQDVGPTAFLIFYDLEKERRLTAEAFGPSQAARAALVQQRSQTDRDTAALRRFASSDTGELPGLDAAIDSLVQEMEQLPKERTAIDSGSSGPDRAFDYYSHLIGSSLRTLTPFGQSTDGNAVTPFETLIDIVGVFDAINREDALITGGRISGKLEGRNRLQVVQAIGVQRYLLESRVVPRLTTAQAAQYGALTGGDAWKTKAATEEWLTGAATTPDGAVTMKPDQTQWRAAMDTVQQQMLLLMVDGRRAVQDIGNTDVHQTVSRLVTVYALTAAAVALVITVTWRLTLLLRRRIHALQAQAQRLRERLPDVVARLSRGEDVEVDREVPELPTPSDELGELGRTLNLASRSAVATAVRQAEQHRGFERLLQRLARRTQLLIGLQLKKLDELERRHEDPEVLEGLFELDHLTARLRRYEENLVILAGGQPQRRWRKPVPLLDVLRAAQSEVQDYRRITMEVEGSPWISARAIGTLTHVLAELMENAAAFSKPPAPVSVRAGAAGRGAIVEVEDRGLGMEAEQYAAANALMQDPPALDVMDRADDVRLGLYAVARLAAALGLAVELQPSVFGGTRAVVFIPEALVVEHHQPFDPSQPVRGVHTPDLRHSLVRVLGTSAGLPSRGPGQAAADAGDRLDPVVAALPVVRPDGPGQGPLPRRVPQESLAPELRTAPGQSHLPGRGAGFLPGTIRPERSAAVISAFRRQSRGPRPEIRPEGPVPTPSLPSRTSQTEDER
ncbi:nitrate- and nitrite sensing domain-containing protein [Kitasatospora sp. YST-16]|uniref:sensor histidine kinase n=1 Tax=Kitasatospora sp. YST-16 TaxID=2998080 RepID=UPI002283A95F|nr:nitrate- and nitrite sensing domain-containing protein [Kitasatospora sp. YST-16]WAL74659.1 nitrate- and nitrite sensing domain-containing protein [Kitasatospora sp. YST-16]WNW40717.1 nitrate- and nitrite sensing domain-containing protein [Streptomyces sp. Li-HN-5-13]